MTRPIIVAIDPRSDDPSPAALGRLLAQLLDAPLVQARESDPHPASALRELAAREHAQLLVIGASKRGLVGRALPGAVTDRLLHDAPCPVAVVPAGREPERLRVIGVAFTDTPDGRAALALAERLAFAADARVRVLSVAEPPEPLVALTVDELALDYVRLAHEEAAETAVRRGLDRLPENRSAGGRTLAGDPVEALAAVSEELDLLVCGSRAHGPLRTAVAGGTSHALVRRAACPVIVVPADAPTSGGVRT